MAVATGGASFEALLDAGGDLVCRDLTDDRALDALIHGGIRRSPDPLQVPRGDR